MNFKGYELDLFQSQAIQALEAGKSVIVAAPTGAGKTVIAEYAIEKAIADGKQIIYTAPIKALSNQKFRDFSADYKDKIGIMTGDVIVNPDAPVLIMTTEIFRNIVFEGEAGRLDSIETVIFDEIHYINDIQRGTVWEESLIFAPQHIRFICLSATIPNFAEFGDWMRSVRDVPIETISESHRPVPLEVSIWIPGYGLRNLDFLKQLEKEKDSRERPKKGGNVELVKRLRDENKLPCLYFHFSRMGCEEYAQYFRGMSLLKNDERRRALELFDGMAAQFGVNVNRGHALMMRNLLKSGVAFHHAGVLPVLKEMLERLYTMGLIKLLFTTETFAVGINMPARSVVFNNVTKHDGISHRHLTAREFQQMAGRAGRRGIDPVGFVYACVDPRDASFEAVSRMLARDAEDIESQFSLSYSSILNLYQQHGDDIYTVCEKSFNTFKTIGQVDALKKRLKDIETELTVIRSEKCPEGKPLNIVESMSLFLSKRDEFFRLKDLLRKRNRKKRASMFKTIERINQLKDEIDELECSKCKLMKTCRSRAMKARRYEKDLGEISSEAVEVENSQRSLLARRMGFLKSLGYLDDNGLLSRGIVASQIFGYELQFTELFFEGYFEELAPEEINVLVSSIVFESRRGDNFKRIRDNRIAGIIGRAEGRIAQLRKMEREADLPNLIKGIDPKLNSAVLEWSRGCSFEDLKKYTSGDDGDLVRSFRLVVDFLRQMRRAINEPAFGAKLDQAVKLIYRDIVDAETQLRSELGLEKTTD